MSPAYFFWKAQVSFSVPKLWKQVLLKSTKQARIPAPALCSDLNIQFQGRGIAKRGRVSISRHQSSLKTDFFKQNQLQFSKINFPLSSLFKVMGTPCCSLWHLSQQAVTNKIWQEDTLLVIWLLFCAFLPAMPQCFQPCASNAVSQLLPFSSVLMAIVTQMIAERTNKSPHFLSAIWHYFPV